MSTYNTINREKHISLSVLIIAGISALLVYYQAGRVAPLIDYSYHIENAYRISIGEFPFRDFKLVVMPGTYLITALLMKLGGRWFSLDWLVIYACVSQFLIIWLTYFIIKSLYGFDQITNNSILLLVLFSGYVIYPFPIYNGDVILFILVALSYLLRLLFSDKKSLSLFFISGLLIALPVFFKQNVGIVFLLSCFLVLSFTTISDSLILSPKQLFMIFLGSLLPFFIFFIILLSQAAWDQAVFQLFEHAGRMKKPIEMSITLAISYFSHGALGSYVVFVVPVLFLLLTSLSEEVKSISFALLPLFMSVIVGGISYIMGGTPYGSQLLSIWYIVVVSSVVLMIISLYRYRFRKDTHLFVVLFPIIPILTTQGAFLSQGVTGSSLHMEPLLVLMCASILSALLNNTSSIKWENLIISTGFSLSLFFAFYAYNNIRMSFIDLHGELNSAHTHPKLGHIISASGPWLPHIESILNFVSVNIPRDDTISVFPGEDPFFFLSERVPHQSCSQLNSITCPQTIEQVFSELVSNNITWVIVKRNFQCPNGFDLPKWGSLLEPDKIPSHYILQAQSDFYYVFKRKPSQ